MAAVELTHLAEDDATGVMWDITRHATQESLVVCQTSLRTRSGVHELLDAENPLYHIFHTLRLHQRQF